MLVQGVAGFSFAKLVLDRWAFVSCHALRGVVLIAFLALVKPYAAPVVAGIWRP
jgi:alpha-1,6-mannosyltransferase